MIYGRWYKYNAAPDDQTVDYQWGIRVPDLTDHTGKIATVVKANGGMETVVLTALIREERIGAERFTVYTFKRHGTPAPEAPVDMTNLKPMLWNRPDKEYHQKPIYADHYFRRGFQNHEKYNALPKEDRRAKMYRCGTCNKQVAVAKSPKTGKMVVCKVEQVQHTYKRSRRGPTYTTKPEVYFYPFVPHQCDGQGGSADSGVT